MTALRSGVQMPTSCEERLGIDPSNAEAGDHWLDQYLPYRLYRVTNRLNAKLLRRLKVIGIGPTQWRVLSVLQSCGTLSIGRITEATLMEQPTVSRVVQQMEQDGFVVRRPSSQDTRVTDVALTPAGRAAFGAILPTARRHQALALEGFARDEIATLRALLKRIEANIDLYE